MRKLALILAVFVSALAVACGGGGGGGDGGSGSGSTPTPSGPVQEIQVRMTSDGIQPHDLVISPGQFKVVLTNETTKVRKFIANRWQLQLEAAPGETRESLVYTESAIGSYECHEESRAIQAKWKCKIVVQ